MHLKSLTLKGFKSFASATTLKFEPGICAVVGPNGSGKSNVVDALAWVMGEQGAKNLRGGKMQDVIFAGAGDRKPLGRAEVTLTIDNGDGALPIDYSEVSITRRMFRDGASEYEINGSRARLMDIQELLSDSGIGREMHIIVGQGKLAEILESRPEERRSYIEEAAGVLKHRRRKEKAQRKLTGMQANLDRLQDLTDELGKQLKPLARQAEAAQRAATVQADLRESRSRLAVADLGALRAKLHDAAGQAAALQAQVDTCSEQLDQATEALSLAEGELAKATPKAEAAQELWFELSALAERIQATIRIAADRAQHSAVTEYSGPDPDDLERRAEEAERHQNELDEAVEIARERVNSLAEELEERRAAAHEAEREHLAAVRAIADRREGVVRLLAQEESQRGQLESARAELGRLTEAQEEATTRVARAEAQGADATEARAESERTVVHRTEEHRQAAAEAEAAEGRLEELRGTERDLERRISSLEARIATLAVPERDKSDLPGPGSWTQLADLVQTKHEKALAAALGEIAGALVGRAWEAAHLPEADARARTVVMEDGAPGAGPGGAPEAERWRLDATLPEHSGAVWLIDEVDAAASIAPAMNRLLADVVLVPNLETGREIVAADPRLRAVTQSGALVGAGWYAVGSGSRSPVEAATEVAKAERELADAEGRLAEFAGTLTGARTAAEERRVAVASAKAKLAEAEATAAALKREENAAERQLSAARQDADRATSRLIKLHQTIAERETALAETAERLARADADAEDGDEPSPERRDATAAELAQVQAMDMSARLELRTAEERAGSARGKGESLRRQASHERTARARHETAMARRRRAAELASKVTELARDLAERTATALTEAAERRDEAQRRKQLSTTHVAEAKRAQSAAQAQLNRLTDSSHAQEIALSQAKVRIEEAEAKVAEQLGPVDALVEQYPLEEDFDYAAEQRRRKQAEKDLASLGKVNPLALEEYRALEERYQFLATQLADVEQARADLTQVIEDVDAKILQLFTDAWNDVEREFPKVFATLFPGGEGRLVLTEPDDLLATGIEVEARPPGKKVKRLTLLSGGEKSLTALAMLVAIFRARPSPFYVMDEVEAALDDVNLRRLIALFEDLRGDSQLIVITHQKPTMDIANVLYGVTMRGDGITRVISQRMSPHAQEKTVDLTVDAE